MPERHTKPDKALNIRNLLRAQMPADALPFITRAAYVFAPAIILIAPFLNFIVYQDYHLLRSEIFISGGIVWTAGILLGAVMALRPQTLGQILLVTCILVSLDMGFPHFRLKALVLTNATPWSVILWHWAVIIGLLVGARLLYRYFSVIVLIVFAVVSGSTVLIPVTDQPRGVTFERAVEAKTSKDPIIHLVLDEFIAIEGIPVDIAGGSALRKELKQFFLGNGFRLYGGAFSHSSETQHAMAALLNGQFFPSKQTAFENVRGRSSWLLRRNAWFEQLAAEGYAIQAYGNSWISYCAEENAQIELCHLFLANSIKHLESLTVPDSEKAKVILSAFLELSSMNVSLREIANLPIYRLGSLATAEVLRHLAETVESGGTGRLVFAHLLSPHYSYVYQADCELKPDIDTWKNRTLPFHRDGEPINTLNSRIERYKAYLEQIRCTQGQLQALFDSLRAAGRYEESTIIIHGDHGSRISIWNPGITVSDRLSDRDIVDNYSTLYAIKQPGVAPAYDSTERSIQALFAEAFLRRPLHPESGEIVLRGVERLDRDLSNVHRLRPFRDHGP